ncbi:MAG: hypothetical protein NTV95_00650 [Candidatus Saccharibacteria bacterium]|nr:hypothetical protein [Candidatus Saccharibacteria bacterium]
MSEDQPHVPINPQEQQIMPDIPQEGQFYMVRTGGDVEPGWSLDHSRYNTDNGTVVAYKEQFDELGQPLGNLEETVNREDFLVFNKPENVEARRQEQLQADLGEDAVRNEVDAPYPQRIEQLFSPVGKKEDKQPDVNPYDALHDPSINMEDRDVKDAEVRSPKGRGIVTEESLKVARDEYMEPLLQGSKDIRISEMIKAAAHNSPLTSEDAMQLLREDSSLRKEVGAYLLAKLEANTAILPERVARNNQKKANMAGYESIPSMSSHEYVALLAIAKLDGSFNYEQDPIQKDKSGNVLLGQHRAAADMMLKGY